MITRSSISPFAAADRFGSGSARWVAPMGRPRGLRRPAASLVGAALASVLVVVAPATVAKQTADGETGCGEWTALSAGMVGCRWEPPRADQPVENRRLDTTDLRHAEARRQLQALQSAKANAGSKQTRATRGKGTSRRNAETGAKQARSARGKGGVKQQLTAVAVEPSQELAATVATLEATLLDAELTATAPPSGVWLRTRAAGLYAVSVADLAAGLDESPTTVRDKAKAGTLVLTTGGEHRGWFFDDARDEVLFVGESYQSFYTDQNAHRLSFGPDVSWLALSSARTVGSPTQATGAAAPFRETLLFEEEPDMLYSTWTVASEPDADYWFWDYLYGGYKDQIQVPLAIPNPAPGGTAQMRIRLRGWTDLEAGDEHQVYAELNGTDIGSVLIWDGFAEAILVAEFDQSLLSSDGTNTLVLRNIYDSGTHPGQWLDDIEIDYDRMPIADGGVLWLDWAAEGVQTVTNFASSDILVIQSPIENAVLRQDARIESDDTGGWQVTFDVPTATDYLVIERTAIAAPVVAPDYPVSPSLASTENAADYLIITAPEFMATAEALATYRTTDFGVVKVVMVDDIYDEFSFGREDPTAITQFMARVSEWSRVPTDVAIIGKGSLDHKDRMGYGDSFVPTLMTDTPWALVPSDDRLLGGANLTQFAFARLPITSDQQGASYLQKLTDYEAGAPDAETEAVLVADQPDEAGDFHANVDILADRLAPFFAGVTTYKHPEQSGQAGLLAGLGADYLSYDGHGSSLNLGKSDSLLTWQEAQGLSNGVSSVFTALTCSAGDWSFPGLPSVAAALVLNPAGGSIAAFAPTGYSLDADAQTLGNAYVDRLFLDGDTLAQAALSAKTETSGQIPGFMARIYSIIGEPGVRAR